MKRAYADTSRGQIHYCYDGKGDSLLLMHRTASSSLMFERAMPALARHFSVIAIDTLGYGQSDKPSKQMEIPDYAKCVAEFLDALGIGQAIILGHHTGGAIAVEVAASYREHVVKLIICGVPYWETEEREHLAKTLAPPVVLKEDGSHLLSIWERARKWYPGGGVEEWQKATLETLMAGGYARTGMEAVFRYDIGARLPLLRCPTLVMCGDRDMLLKANKPALALIPKAREVVIPGAGSAVVDEKTEEFINAVLDFLKSSEV